MNSHGTFCERKQFDFRGCEMEKYEYKNKSLEKCQSSSRKKNKPDTMELRYRELIHLSTISLYMKFMDGKYYFSPFTLFSQYNKYSGLIDNKKMDFFLRLRRERDKIEKHWSFYEETLIFFAIRLFCIQR